ncbi:MAG: multiple monosaccharide ABC transporter permease [Christensenellales bacterium]|jgi:putative multiple sugar transport system permease protein
MEKKRSILTNNVERFRQYGMMIVLVFLVLFFHFITGGLVLTPLNITNIMLQNAYVLILAIGVLPVIVTANIDLSIGSVVGFIGAIAAILQVQVKASVPVTVLACLIVGALVGVWQGYWVAMAGIPAFIVTLSSMLIFRGLTILLLGSGSLGPLSEGFQAISSSFIPDIFQGQGLHIFTLIIGAVCCAFIIFRELMTRRSRKSHGVEVGSFAFTIARLVVLCAGVMLFTYYFAMYSGIPSVVVLLVALVVIYSFIMRRSTVGRHVYAIGGNRRAADLSGIKSKKVIMLTFINMGIMAAVAAVVFTARLNAGTPKAGTGFEMDAIAACFIGGVSVKGGAGTVMGAVIGCCFMGVLNNGMSILGLPIDLQQAIKGLVILLSVALDLYSKSKQK